jgi:hypothetical protein
MEIAVSRGSDRKATLSDSVALQGIALGLRPGRHRPAARDLREQAMLLPSGRKRNRVLDGIPEFIL